MSTAKSRSDSVTSEADPQALVGTTIRGRYKVEALLGTGGMGAVYRVLHTGIDKHLALKLLSARMGKNKTVVKRFEREAKAAANFGHPHVAAASDYGRTDDGQFYLVMELIEGQELRQAMDDAMPAMQPVRAFHIARQIASALSRAHKLGIVHRDLKPENIMLVKHEGQDDFVKVLDFGLALISRNLNVDEADEHQAMTAPKITAVGEIFGTPSYMSPEQTVGAATDTRTDLYALGIILYEMLTGVRPFVGKNPVALVVRLLAKQPADRYQTPDELIAAIDKIAATHNLTWPGSTSGNVPAPGSGMDPDAPTVATVGKPPAKAVKAAPVKKAAAKPDAKRSPLMFVGIVILLAVLVAVIWQVRVKQDGAQPTSTPATDTAEPAPSNSDPAPQNTEPTPTRRGGKHRGGRDRK
jgi:serine/threonine protein kinase